MRNILKTAIIFTIILSNPYVHAFYVPDLFGAYQRGAEAAREANARDAYYYAQMNQPRFYFEVWEPGKKKPKRNLNLSLKKEENLCWGVYNLPFENGTTVYASELFTMPYNGGFTGASPNETKQKITAYQQVKPNAIGFDKQILVKNGEAGTCWTFHPTQTPKGKYFLKIGVGNKELGTHAFTIVD